MNEARLVQITRRKKIAEEEFYPMINFMYRRIWQNILPPQIPTAGLTIKKANNVITPADAPVPDCVSCGLCCAAMLCVGISPDEDEKISAENYWDITVEGERGEILVDRYLRRNEETFACAQLEGTLGERVGCRIYEHRPEVCHRFEAGSDKCRALRRAFGIEPFLSLTEMSEAIEKLETQPERSPSSETIRGVNFVERADDLQISALLKDGSTKTIHAFDPKRESWRQFEFDGLTLSQAADLIKSRNELR